jgi:hypothetical protein
MSMSKTILSGFVLSLFAASAYASSNSPWTPAEESGEITVRFASQTADRFFAGDAQMPLPADLDQDASTLELSYGITDALALDLRLGYTSSDFITVTDPPLAPEGGLSGVQDTRIGLRWNLTGTEPQLPAITLGLAAVIAGNYDVGALPAVGDGESGIEALLLAGQVFDSGLSLSGGYTRREFNNEVPSQNVFDLAAGYSFNDHFSGGLFYQNVSANGDLDIGAPGFTPARFPEVDEEYSLYGASAGFALTDVWYLSADVGRKNDGKNTAKSRFFQVALSYLF